MDILVLIVLAIAVVIIYVKTANKKNTNIINETIEEEILLRVEPRNLKVFCKSCGNKELKSGEIIPIEGIGCFYVKGYTLKGEEVRLNGSGLSWASSCAVVNFANKTGLENCINCSSGSLRDVWVKYNNSIIFGWKIDFGKRSK